MSTTPRDAEALFNRLWEAVPADAPSPEQLRAEHGPLLRQIREALADGFAAQRTGAPMARTDWKTNDARETIAATLLQHPIHHCDAAAFKQFNTIPATLRVGALAQGIPMVTYDKMQLD